MSDMVNIVQHTCQVKDIDQLRKVLDKSIVLLLIYIDCSSLISSSLPTWLRSRNRIWFNLILTTIEQRYCTRKQLGPKSNALPRTLQFGLRNTSWNIRLNLALRENRLLISSIGYGHKMLLLISLRKEVEKVLSSRISGWRLLTCSKGSLERLGY